MRVKGLERRCVKKLTLKPIELRFGKGKKRFAIILRRTAFAHAKDLLLSILALQLVQGKFICGSL